MLHRRIVGIIGEFGLQKSTVGGNILDRFMRAEVYKGKKGDWSTISPDKMRVLKEQMCFTSLNFDQDSQILNDFLKEYVFQDSGKIEIEVERFKILELLF